MNRNEAKNELKQMLPTFLQPARKKVNGIQTFICPKCGNGSGKDGDGIALDTKTHRYKCFVCGLNEDIIGLWKKHTGNQDDKQVFNDLYKYYNISVNDSQHNYKPIKKNKPTEQSIGDFKNFFLEAQKNILMTNYWAERGLSEEIIKQFKLGFIKDWVNPKSPNSLPSPRLIIPITENSYLARDTRTNIPEIQSKYKKIKVKNIDRVSWVFNVQELSKAKNPIFVTEGELDAISIVEAGGAAVALGSTAYTNGFLDVLKKFKPTQPLIIALDNESDPDKAKRIENISIELENNIKNLGIEVYRIIPSELTGIYKDANEHLVHNRNAFIECIKKIYIKIKELQEEKDNAEKEAYLAGSSFNYLPEFINGIKESVNTPYIPTGFNQLDKIFDGGLYEGLYICGAISSLGKTTLMLQLCDQIAMSDNTVIIFSLEMAQRELIAKSISRHTLIEVDKGNGKMKNAKTVRGITCGKRYEKYNQEEVSLIDSSIKKYSEYAKNIFIYEGIGDVGVFEIRKKIEEHIKYTGKKPVVLIDYVQILTPIDIRASDKQNMDKSVLELKRISRDFKIPVIGISSFNRTNYKEAVTMEAFKESGSLEYGSDVLIGLQLKGAGTSGFDVNQAKQKNPREIELVILKNRNGATGGVVPFKYYPLFNYFEEIKQV